MNIWVIKIMGIIILGRTMVDRITTLYITTDKIIDRIIDIVNINMQDKTIKRIGILRAVSNNKIVSIISIENSNMSINYKGCRKY
jgi:hypothetical protein